MARHEHAHREVAAEIAAGGEFVTEEVRAAAPFTELLASWNVGVRDGGGFVVDVRVAIGEERTPWLRIGQFGVAPGTKATAGAAVECEAGRIDVDWFRSERAFDRAALRVTSVGSSPLALARFDFCFTDRRAQAEAAEPVSGRVIEIDVPARSQRSEAPALVDRICSPTALAMVLAYRGVDVPTARVAQLAFDVEHDLYGNWGNAIQAAFVLGVPGFLARFSSWREVERELERGQPLIASIGVGPGGLTGAPYAKTAGHLIVVRGFDGGGGVIVNDPAAEPGTERRVYRRSELTRCWLERGGTAYVLLPRPRVTSSGARAG